MTQETALRILKTGANVFLTGEPGAGKTHTINRYVAWLRSHGIEPAITASTGIAATHIGGMTIHSWSGIGIKTHLTSDDKRRLRENNRLATRMLKTQVLIIDEISMLDGQTLETVDAACRTLRETDEPFGGMQIVLVGDFFQLPPIQKPAFARRPQEDDGVQSFFEEDDGEEAFPDSPFAFHAHAWRNADPAVCYLSEQHRQADTRYLALLAALRRGEVTSHVSQLLQTRRIPPPRDGIQTRLFTHNANVDRVNDAQLDALPGEVHQFEMRSFGNPRVTESLKKSCLSPEFLRLKKDARVMFTKNDPAGAFVNGTLGHVAGFSTDTGTPIIQTVTGRQVSVAPVDWAMSDGVKELGKITQLPLRLAWAVTVHKSQGMTLDAAEMDLSGAFEYGQGYVALSRVRSLEGLYVNGWNQRALQVHPEILTCDKAFKRQSGIACAGDEATSSADQAAAERAFIITCEGSVEELSLEEQRAGKAPKEKGPSTHERTLMLFNEGKTLPDIAKIRNLVTSTITSHIEVLVNEGKITRADAMRIIPTRLASHLPTLHVALKAANGSLGAARARLKNTASFEDLRLARIVMDNNT